MKTKSTGQAETGGSNIWDNTNEHAQLFPFVPREQFSFNWPIVKLWYPVLINVFIAVTHPPHPT